MRSLTHRSRPRHAAWSLLALAGLLVVPLLLGTPVSAQPAAAVPVVRPNVLFVLTDDQDLESMARMPYVSSQKWVTFDNAYSNNHLCCPSRATIFKGQWDTHTGVENNAQAGHFSEAETLPVWLQRAGYRTSLSGKYLNGYMERKPYVPAGWDNWMASGGKGNGYPQYNWNSSDGHVITRHPGYEADILATHLQQFIAEPDSRPFFAMFTPTATHSPWDASPSRTGMFDGAAVPEGPEFDEPDVSDKPAWIQALPRVDRAKTDLTQRRGWAADVSVDDIMRQTDDVLRQTGTYDNTVVIYMGDNGYSFGDHRWLTKQCAYASCSHVPLLVRYPGAHPHHVSGLTTNVDIASTIAAITGATPTLTQDGRSFLPQVLGRREPTGESRALLGHSPGGDANGVDGKANSIPGFWSVRESRWLYVEIDTGERELYDEAADAHELVNVAGRPEYAVQQQRLAQRLAELKREAGADGTLDPHGPSGAPLPDLMDDRD